jgi:hypothetical protein
MMFSSLKRFSGLFLLLLVLSACGTSLSGTKNISPANNQFRLHEIVWDVNLPDSWNRMSKPLDAKADVPFFAAGGTQNLVVLPGSGFKENLITEYITNGKTKFESFEVLDETTSTLKFKGALAEGEALSIFDQRIYRWDDGADLFLIVSCSYPQDLSANQCEAIFDTIKKSE